MTSAARPPTQRWSILAAFIVALVAPTAAQAATFTVTKTSDSGAGSLRQALADAKASGGPDTIGFAPDVTGKITLTSGGFRSRATSRSSGRAQTR